jgi:hypothetical protein
MTWREEPWKHCHPARSSPRPEDLVAAFHALASERGPEFAGVAMFAYLTKNLGASAGPGGGDLEDHLANAKDSERREKQKEWRER